jgi:hypothetical protein
MDYRRTFVSRALELIQSYKGPVSYDVRNIVRELSAMREPRSLSTDEFNLLQDAADRIDTQIKINKVQRSMRRNGGDENSPEPVRTYEQRYYHHRRPR